MNRPMIGYTWLQTGLATRRSRAILSRAALALTTLLVLSTVAPPEIEAQSSGLVPPGSNVPSPLEDGGKPSTAHQLSGPIHLMIELDDEPAVVSASRAGGTAGLSASASRSQAARIDRAQQTVMSGLQSRGVNARVLYRTHAAYNGIATIVDASQIDRIKAEPGVKDVHLSALVERDNAGSVPFIEADNAWSASPTAFNGTGMKVGIVDTGIDYVHLNFGGAGNYAGSNRTVINEPGFTFPTAVVAGGTDLAGDNYNSGSTDPAKNTPILPPLEPLATGPCIATPGLSVPPSPSAPGLLTVGQGDGLVHESDGPMLAIGTGPEALDWQPGLRDSPAVAGLNFSTDVLVGLFVGRRATGGHRVTIESVTASGGGVCVTASVMPPRPDMSVTQAETYPYHVVAVKRAGLPLTPGTVWTAARPDGVLVAETTIP
jgi:hypothetical protein